MKYRIKEFREEKGISLIELANQTGITRQYLSSIEKGMVDNISTKLLVSIAKALDKKVDEILILP